MRPQLDIIENKDDLHLRWLEEFKQYCSVPDNGRDALLERLLRSAIMRVQEYSNRALVVCRVRQTARSNPETGLLRLYLGGGKDLTVRFVDTPFPASYEPTGGGSIFVRPRGAAVTAEFTTDPVRSWLDEAKPTVFRYATALYDGQSAEALGSILNEVL